MTPSKACPPTCLRRLLTADAYLFWSFHSKYNIWVSILIFPQLHSLPGNYFFFFPNEKTMHRIQESLHHLLQFRRAYRYWILHSNSQSFHTNQRTSPSWRRQAKSLTARISLEGLTQGVQLWSALETKMVAKSPVHSTEGKGWAQWEAAQGGLWVSQIKSRVQARTNRVQVAQNTQKYSGPAWQTSESHLCLSTAAI